ncbi:hypothetical protein Tco_0442672 [Tanacetum coccineum]
MKILPVSSSNSTAVDVLIMRTCKHGESNTYVLEDPTIYAGNPVNEVQTSVLQPHSIKKTLILTELQLNDKLNFVEEPVEVIDREIKQLRQSRIPIIKVRWNSKRGPEFTWEREDEIRAKYPHPFSSISSKSN